ncbi:MAG: hypothetical protein HY334_04200 [Armatimonadetes bacterium]|nr:hypothetical protein [Armatimonadota bacterium]
MRTGLLRGGIAPGALAGLLGGAISAAALSRLGALPPTASLVRADAAAAGFVLHVLFGIVLGAGFGVLVWHQRAGAGETLFWGLTYGALCWFLGPLTLMSLWLLGFLAWDLHSAQEAFPSLLGYLLYGGVTGLTLALIRRDRRPTGSGARAGAVLRGVLAGLMGGSLLRLMLEAQGLLTTLPSMMSGAWPGWVVILLMGALAGAGYALLYPHPPDGSGPGLIRGMVYGFCWWVIGSLAPLPGARGGGEPAAGSALGDFSMLPGYLLFGAATALFYAWLDGLGRLLFSDMVGARDEEGVGTEGLRALGRGALAGLIGGALFALVIVQIGGLAAMRGVVGSSSIWGLIAQVVVAQAIGISYGFLFRRQSYDVGSGLGWGISYGFLWWVLGPLTLTPLFLGSAPRWRVEAAAELFPYLIGHLAYGAALGVIFHLLEARHNPWWTPRSKVEAARVARRREQVLTSAPALWALVAVIALTLPILLAR